MGAVDGTTSLAVTYWPRAKAGEFIDNIVLLDIGCHDAQEKKTAKYEAEHNVDLHAKARAHTAQWRKKTT